MARTLKKQKVRLVDTSGSRRPARRCALTREVGAKDELLRLALDPEGRLFVDIRARAPGRGVYVSPRREVVELAMTPKGLGRLFRGRATGVGFTIDDGALPERPALRGLLEDRLVELLGLARRSGALTLGGDAVMERLARGPNRGATLILAEDLGRTTGERARKAFEAASDMARFRSIGSKLRFGEALGRGETGVLLVEPGTLADQVAAESKRCVLLEGGTEDRWSDPKSEHDEGADTEAPDEDAGGRSGSGRRAGNETRRGESRRMDAKTSGRKPGSGARGMVTHG